MNSFKKNFQHFLKSFKTFSFEHLEQNQPSRYVIEINGSEKYPGTFQRKHPKWHQYVTGRFQTCNFRKDSLRLTSSEVLKKDILMLVDSLMGKIIEKELFPVRIFHQMVPVFFIFFCALKYEDQKKPTF